MVHRAVHRQHNNSGRSITTAGFEPSIDFQGQRNSGTNSTKVPAGGGSHGGVVNNTGTMRTQPHRTSASTTALAEPSMREPEMKVLASPLNFPPRGTTFQSTTQAASQVVEVRVQVLRPPVTASAWNAPVLTGRWMVRPPGGSLAASTIPVRSLLIQPAEPPLVFELSTVSTSKDN